MREDTRENLKVTALALASIPVLFGIVLLVQWAGLWQWFRLMWWTAVIFIFVGVWYGKGLKRVGPLSVFLGATVLHAAALFLYIRAGHPFPSLSFQVLSGPIEATALIALLMLVGGPPEHRTHHANRSK